MSAPVEHTLPSPTPPINPDTASFWRHANQGRLVLPHCSDCDAWVYYPRPRCPECGSGRLIETTVSGHGTVYTHTTIAKGAGDWAAAGAYVLAYVELDEGPRVLTNVVGVAPEDVVIGMQVEVHFDPAGDSVALARFRPLEPSRDSALKE